ncbi:MAG: zinc ABC transporter substrate-binding protein [Chloroflexi bacterium]|nr:zinc ABC transporter substrate-binding protein [Chloroflexota bacterium]
MRLDITPPRTVSRKSTASPAHVGRRFAAAGGLLAVFGAALFGCAGGGSTSAPSTGASGAPPLQVVTTTTVFADIVRNVGGERVVVASIIPAGVGPEDYEPRPGDARRLASAQLLVSNGVGLDDFLADLLRSGSGGSTPRLVLGDGIPTIEQAGEPNPHFWLDPSLVAKHYLPAIQSKLTELDPAGADVYRVNGAAYAAALARLDEELLALVGSLPPANRKLVTFHDAYPYLARHFGFEQVGVIVENVGQEPTAAELASLVAAVRSTGARAVFGEAQFSPKLAQTLAAEAGITRVVTTLYNDALGPPPADSYLGMLRYDIEQIVGALR